MMEMERFMEVIRDARDRVGAGERERDIDGLVTGLLEQLRAAAEAEREAEHEWVLGLA